MRFNCKKKPVLAATQLQDDGLGFVPRFRRFASVVIVIILMLSAVSFMSDSASAQRNDAADAPLNLAEGVDALTTGNAGSQPTQATATPSKQESLNLWSLLLRGGWLMLPIFVMSVAVITIAIERVLGLRNRKILPTEFVEELGILASTGRFDPKEAYRICQAFPSAAAVVVRSMLLRVGRPLAEVERAVSEASDREASRLYGNVRWLNLIAVVAPLVGLFGTVWGMILAFFQTSLLTTGQNKSVVLADGIYGALVTTLGGLAVAIPAAVFSHYFEGRIQKLFFQIDELIMNLLPQIEKYEGRLRLSQSDLGGHGNGDASPAAPAQQAPRPGKPIQTPQ